MALETTTRDRDPFQDHTPPEQLTVPESMGREQFRAMGTTVSVLLPERSIHAGAGAVRLLFEHWEKILSRFQPESELSRLNQQAGKPVRVSNLLFHVTRAALNAAQVSKGVYDPTLLRQLERLGYARSFDELPTDIPEREYSPNSGGDWRAIRLNSRERSITLPEGSGLDLGGIAKGMAVDAALHLLYQSGIQTALVNAGGDLAVMGMPPGQQHWPLLIDGPQRSWVIPFQYGALATSGIARRHWRQGEQVRHHLLDPRTGEPVLTTLWSVTAAAGTCEQAEVAAKVAFLLGIEQGAHFLKRHGLAGLFVCKDGRWIAAGPWPVKSMRDNSTSEAAPSC